MSSSFRRPIIRPRTMICAAIAMLLIVVVECAGFNMPFWITLSASTDTSSAANSLGPGLERTDDGLLRVTDPTQAYLDVSADGTSSYARVDTVSPSQGRSTGSGRNADEAPLMSFHLRFDGDGVAGRTQTMTVSSSRSLYVRVNADSSIRVWVQEQRGALVPIAAVRANARVPFQWSWIRVAALSFALLLVLLWRPGSRLWRTRLDTSDRMQRLALAGALSVIGVISIALIIWQILIASPLSFHKSGGYTYDFDQYDHVAQALLHGHAWLDLPVPGRLADAANPYDIITRNGLLADGVSPIYWDYAFHDGRWYSYFGVLPALLLFLPYRAVTSLWVPGGMALPTAAAELLLMFGFVTFGCLLIVRLIRRITARASLAGVSMILVFFVLATNSSYLWFRMNFYSIPIAASLLLTCLGLWLWLGAIRPSSDSGRRTAAWAGWDVRGAAPLSLPHLAAGSACIAANFGCRPTFALSALLGVALFWPQIVAILVGLRSHRLSWGRALKAPMAVLLPAAVVVVPLMAYNVARFGGPLDFGSDYQMTVTDMTSYRLPAVDIPYMAYYYLLLPVRFVGSFPYLSIQPTPLPEWGFAEPIVGGLFALCPLALLAFLSPWFRRRLPRPWGATLCVSLALGLTLAGIDIVAGGLGWRYMSDFGWLFALAALPALLRMMEGKAVFETPLGDDPDDDPAYSRTPIRRHVIRLLLMLALLYSLAIMVLSCFVPGRDDSLINNSPALFHDVRSWFALLGLN